MAQKTLNLKPLLDIVGFQENKVFFKKLVRKGPQLLLEAFLDQSLIVKLFSKYVFD